MADLALDHGLAQRTLGGVVGGFDALDFQECVAKRAASPWSQRIVPTLLNI
jgi:hypothetical protein